jgi:hypothetical protein
VPLTIKTGSATTASGTTGHSGNGLPALLCIPLVGLLGLLRARKSLKSALLLVLVAAALCASAFQITGCGGGYKPTGGNNSTSGTTPPGKYFIKVTSDTTNPATTYEAVIEVDVQL